MKEQIVAVIVFIILHIIICIWLTVIKRHIDTIRLENIMPLVYAVPVFGAVCFGLRLWEEHKNRLGGRDIDTKQKDIMKGRYQKIQVEEDAQTQVVPLEEALLVNDAKVRHALMLDILHKNPNEYIGILQKARNSDDTEVTHYATTMMMEIQTEYETRLQNYEKEHRQNTEESFLREYILYLQEFINSGLLSGHIINIYRERLSGLLMEYFEVRGDKKGRLLFTAIENELVLGHNEEAGRLLEQASIEYAEDERLYILYGHYYTNRGEYQAFQTMLQELKNKNIYLSHEAKEWLEFWG